MRVVPPPSSSKETARISFLPSANAGVAAATTATAITVVARIMGTLPRAKNFRPAGAPPQIFASGPLGGDHDRRRLPLRRLLLRLRLWRGHDHRIALGRLRLGVGLR